MQENSFSIYPNPVSSICTIKFDNIDEYGGVIRIRDLTNRIVLQKRTEKRTSSLTIDLGFLSAGLYVLEFNNGHTSSGKKIAVID
ncbi:MAG: T9SS type A sorting domain-containing protein [Bacteroidetes bacterium]|nr:T9SS type A sorting domain-containing protein [Bacteroidota bacterium]